MASKKPASQEETQTQEVQELTESTYTSAELAAHAKKIFGTGKECVAAALKFAGIDRCTVKEAKKIVEEFRQKEVK